MKIEIEENSPLPKSKTYPLSKNETDLLKEYFQENLKKEFI